ncbi:MAG: hypothetical protein IJA14_02725 [Alphaproteobacteria bacterium]|nr:hypothetical protein [Alphaproteobacteria bacterium]
MGALGWSSEAGKTIYDYQILPSIKSYAANLAKKDSNLWKETEKKISELKEKAKGSSGDTRKIDEVYNDLLSSAKTPNDEKFNSSVRSYLGLQCKK